MVEIKELRDYTIPYHGNNRSMPYGKLLVTDGKEEKTVRIMDDGYNQYFTFKKKRYYIVNVGTLYHPQYVIDGSIKHAFVLLEKAKYKVVVQNDMCLKVYYKDDTGEFTQITPSDDRAGYYMIEGKVQNLAEWMRK